MNADNLEKEGDRHSRNVQHGNLTSKEKKLSMKIRSRMYGKSDERRFKIAQAERKLREDVEQIDESINESLSVPEQHLLKIARKTVKMNPIMSNAMGGISIKQSHEFLLKNGTSAEKMAAKKYLSVKEDVEQVDELSKGLLKRYKAAATVNADNLEKEGDYYARHLQGKMKDAEMGKRDPVTPKEKKLSMKIRDRMHKKSDARREKIGQAERKLGEDVEQVDEAGQAKL